MVMATNPIRLPEKVLLVFYPGDGHGQLREGGMGGWHECDEDCSLLHSAVLSKIATIISQFRNTGISSRAVKTDRWFNLETIGVPVVVGPRDPWRVPLELKVILDCQGVEREDGGGRLLVESPGTHGMVDVGRENIRSGIQLESWRVHFQPDEKAGKAAVSLAEFNKNLIVTIRSIYSLTRLLPAYRLFQTLSRPKALPISGAHSEQSVGLKLFVIDSTEERSNNNNLSLPLSLDESLLAEGAFEPTSTIEIAPLKTPHGHLYISIRYRKHCHFEYENANTSLSSRIRPSSFENVSLEAAVAAVGVTDVSPLCGRTPINVISNENEYRFGTSLGSRASGRLGGSRFTSDSPRTARSKSMQTLNSPLADTASSSSRRASSPATSHRRTGSSLYEDSVLASFINSCENRPSLQPIPLSLPSISKLRARMETVRSFLHEELLQSTEGRRSRLTFSPVQETDEVPEKSDSQLIFKLGHID